MSLEKLKLITNYTEKDLSKSDTHSLLYVESLTNEDENEYLRELKTKRRDIVIDVILGEKEGSELEGVKIPHNKWKDIPDNNGFLSIAPSVYTANTKVQSFSNYNEIYEELLLFIDKETNSQKNIPTLGSNIDLVFKKEENLTDYENFEAFIRKIKTRLTMCSNIIAMDGGIGKGNFYLVGKDNWNYFQSIEEKQNPLLMPIIYTDKIEDDKVIIGRKNSPDQSGISLFMDLENQKYTRFETNFWKKQYCWFRIKK